MFPCPHCGRVIDSTGSPKNGPWYKYDPGSGRVSLGCGTLILIAIIVSIFSGSGVDSDDIRGLQQDIAAMDRKIDRLEARLLDAAPVEAQENSQPEAAEKKQ